MTRPVQQKGTPESSPENLPEATAESSADATADATANATAAETAGAELIPVKDACARWGIKSAAFYQNSSQCSNHSLAGLVGGEVERD